MERVSVNDMRDKEVINICDGKRLGYIYDVEINVVTGCVVSIVVLLTAAYSASENARSL